MVLATEEYGYILNKSNSIVFFIKKKKKMMEWKSYGDTCSLASFIFFSRLSIKDVIIGVFIIILFLFLLLRRAQGTQQDMKIAKMETEENA